MVYNINYFTFAFKIETCNMRYALLLLLLMFSLGLSAQTLVKGKVMDKKRGLEGVSVALKDSYDGATTDKEGNFSFRTTEKGTFFLTASYLGYKTFEQAIQLKPGDSVVVNILLKEEITELTAVTVTAGTFEASDKKKVTVLSSLDIVTTASGNGDVTEALKSLPGAQQVGESEGLFVRGGTGQETKIFIDGTLVNNFFFSSMPNIAARGRFSPFLFKGTVFSTGGYSALYGQALSSALILETIDFPDMKAANLGISVIGVNAGFQQLSEEKNSSWGINYSYTNLAPAFAVIKQKQDYFQIPVFHGADGNFRFKTSKTGIIKYYTTLGTSKLAFTTPSLDSVGYKDKFSLDNFNMYHNLAWREKIGKKWKLDLGLSYTNNKDDIENGMRDAQDKDVTLTNLEFKENKIRLRGNYFNAKLVLEKRLVGMSALRFGTEYNYSKDNTTFTDYTNTSYLGTLKENLNALFAEGDIYITNAIAAKLGTRLEHSSLINKTNIAPRASLAYKTGKHSQASVAYGFFYQTPEGRLISSSNPLTFTQAAHYIAQYQKVTTDRTLRAELFYKKYNDLVKTGLTGTGQFLAINNDGFGDAKGFDFFWRDKKSIRNVDYWISYSFLETKRDYLNFPGAITPNFAAKHTASFIIKKFVTKIKTQFNGAYNFATGRPFYNIAYDGANNKFNITDQGKTPAYHNFSFSMNYLPFIGKDNAKIFPVYVISISNIFNVRQVYGYQYSYNGLRKQAIVPPSRMFVFIGAFISFGVDRSDEIINSNL